MTFEEYHMYSDIAIRLFNYMNGRINKMNSQCTFQIEMYDLVNGTFGNIRYPNHIYVNIGTMIDAFNPVWGNVINKHDYICTLIAWAIAHELHHADQMIAMLQYSKNMLYRNKVEGDVERASYDWVAAHAQELSQIGGFNVVILNMESDDLPDTGNYKKAGVREFYLQTTENILIRDTNSFRMILPYIEDNQNVQFTFNDTDSVFIKANGKYCLENINLFSALVYKWAGYYDKYTIQCFVDDAEVNGVPVKVIMFNINNPMINPMIFKVL